jgi:predicted enzyme related to lactoylglutathione lyase
MNQPVNPWWHELNTWEPESAIAFYGRTLGWDFEGSGLPDGNEYWIARKDGRPVGGIFVLSEPRYSGIPSHWMTYMAVDDIEAAERAAAFAGGEVIRPATYVSGVGKLAVVSDATGALIGLIEPEPSHALGRVTTH